MADETDNHYPLREALRLGIETSDWTNFFILLEAGANVNAIPRKGLPIAEEAVALGRPGLAILLLERGYKTNLDDLLKTSNIRAFRHGSAEASDNEKLQAILSSESKVRVR